MVLMAVGVKAEEVQATPAMTVWDEDAPINWDIGTTATISPQCFMAAESGMLVRFCAKDIQLGAVGKLWTVAWQDMPDASNIISFTGVYYEWKITEAMLAELQTNGCIVSGFGHTLDAVQLIDPDEIHRLRCMVVDDDIKVWESGSRPILRVKVTNLERKKTGVTAMLSLRDDHFRHVRDFEITDSVKPLMTKTLTFDLTEEMDEPEEAGFYHVTVVANYSQICTEHIGYDPAGISSPADYQDDFESFWQKARADLAQVNPEYSLTKIEEKSTPSRNVYLVEMKSIDNGDGNPVTVRGYYAEPTAPGIYPVYITQSGYDGGGDTPIEAMDGDENPGRIDLDFYVRGQYVNNRPPYQTDNIYGDYFSYNFGDKDKYYYRGAFMDVVRGIDFIASREKADQRNIFVIGPSQGGALSLAAAAFDKRVDAIAAMLPFMGDFPHYFQVASWPGNVARGLQHTLTLGDEDMYRFLSYFDTKNLATLITCPVIIGVGLQDMVCPPFIGMAAYGNLASSDKQYVVDPTHAHEVSDFLYGSCMDFLNSHFRSPTGIHEVEENMNQGTDRTYNITGQQVDDSYTGIVIVSGKKMIRRR